MAWKVRAYPALPSITCNPTQHLAFRTFIQGLGFKVCQLCRHSLHTSPGGTAAAAAKTKPLIQGET